MIESIEGKCGELCYCLFFVVQVGIFGCLILVYNVEMFYWVCKINCEGFECLNLVEKNGCKGLCSYFVLGCVKNSGVYFLFVGFMIIDIIEVCGGMFEGYELKVY